MEIQIEFIDTLIFDLGGVFIKLTGVEQMMEWTRHRYTVGELWDVWLNSDSVKGFETGGMDALTFARGIIDEYDLPVGTDEFLFHFTTWASELFPGSRRLLTGLKNQYTLVSLSNTNSIHWDLLCDRYGLNSFFHHNFPSHEIGKIKPSTDAFDYVLDKLPSPPERVLFFDDTLNNITSARKAGIQGFQVQGLEGLSDMLTQLKLL